MGVFGASTDVQQARVRQVTHENFTQAPVTGDKPVVRDVDPNLRRLL